MFHFMRRDEDLKRVHDLIIDPENKRELEIVVEAKVPEMRALGERKARSVIESNHVMTGEGSALEAEYWLKVKQRWHKRDPKERAPRLSD
jgi:hypothetical protein